MMSNSNIKVSCCCTSKSICAMALMLGHLKGLFNEFQKEIIIIYLSYCNPLMLGIENLSARYVKNI